MELKFFTCALDMHVVILANMSSMCMYNLLLFTLHFTKIHAHVRTYFIHIYVVYMCV